MKTFTLDQIKEAEARYLKHLNDIWGTDEIWAELAADFFPDFSHFLEDEDAWVQKEIEAKDIKI